MSTQSGIEIATPTARLTVTYGITEYGRTGLAIDWEVPGREGEEPDGVIRQGMLSELMTRESLVASDRWDND